MTRKVYIVRGFTIYKMEQINIILQEITENIGIFILGLYILGFMIWGFWKISRKEYSS